MMVREIEVDSESMAEQKLGGYSSRYRFTGKELDPLSGLYDFGARYYDPRLSVWFGVDPLAENHPDYSAFTYTANNPIRFIDPDGQDWYEDENCNKRYDEKLTKANHGEYLKAGQRYLGETYKETTKNGTNNYRKDGSVMFGSQADGVQYMDQASTRDIKNQTEKGWATKQKEQFGFIMGDNILVTPESVNDAETSRPEAAGYEIKDGSFSDPILGKDRNFDATIHTHPLGGDQIPSGSDMDRLKLDYPSKAGFVIGIGSRNISGYNKRGWFPVNDANGKRITIERLKSGVKLPKY